MLQLDLKFFAGCRFRAWMPKRTWRMTYTRAFIRPGYIIHYGVQTYFARMSASVTSRNSRRGGAMYKAGVPITMFKYLLRVSAN